MSRKSTRKSSKSSNQVVSDEKERVATGITSNTESSGMEEPTSSKKKNFLFAVANEGGTFDMYDDSGNAPLETKFEMLSETAHVEENVEIASAQPSKEVSKVPKSNSTKRFPWTDAAEEYMIYECEFFFLFLIQYGKYEIDNSI